MARRMTLEGAKVQVVAELMPYSGGLKRNIVQCLEDFGIPLKLSHTVVDIRGKYRVEGVTLARVENGKPVPGTEENYDCDTLLLSCGLIPENELSRGAGVALNPVTNGPAVNESLETSIPGVLPPGMCSMSTIWWIMCPRKRQRQAGTRRRISKAAGGTKKAGAFPSGAAAVCATPSPPRSGRGRWRESSRCGCGFRVSAGTGALSFMRGIRPFSAAGGLCWLPARWRRCSCDPRCCCPTRRRSRLR